MLATAWTMIALSSATGTPRSCAQGAEFEPVASVKLLSEVVTALAISADGKSLAVAGCDRHIIADQGRAQITLYKTEGLVEGSPIKDIETMVMSISICRDGYSLAFARIDGICEIANIKSASRRSIPEVGISAQFSPGEKFLVGSFGTVVHVWDLAGNRMHTTLEVDHPRCIDTHVAFSLDGKVLAVAGMNWKNESSIVTLYDGETFKKRGQFDSGTKGVFSLAFIPGTSLLAVGGRYGQIAFWDVDSRTPRLTKSIAVSEGEDARVGTLEVSPDGRFLAAQSHGGPLRIWDSRAEKFIQDIPTDATLVAFAPDGRGFVTAQSATPDGRSLLRIWRKTR